MDEFRTSPRSRRRLFVSLAIGLVIGACLAAAWGGFRMGFERGYASGQPRWVKEDLREVAYDVGDLVELDQNGKPDIESLIDALTTTVEPPSWDDVGGLGTIAAIEAKQIRVNQTPDVHESIQRILQSIRNGRQKTRPAEPK
jgi:hypothetical protein